MTKPGFAQLQDVIGDPDFPDLDLALRRGRHIDRDDAAWYTLCLDAQEHLEAFYRRYGCELIHKTDGYFYLLPTSDKVSRRQLAPGDMLVGQALALLYLDPAALERGGLASSDELIAQLSAVLGSDALIAAFNPKRKRFDERVAHKTVRSKVAEAVRRLAALGFVELGAEDRLRLRPSLLRFAEPVRGLSEPAEALAKLAAQGEVALEPESSAADGGDELDGVEGEGGDELDDGEQLEEPGAASADEQRVVAAESGEALVSEERGEADSLRERSFDEGDDGLADEEGAEADVTSWGWYRSPAKSSDDVESAGDDDAGSQAEAEAPSELADAGDHEPEDDALHEKPIPPEVSG